MPRPLKDDPMHGPPARPKQRRANGETTRMEIVETAGRLFAAHGYHGTTSKAISARAKVNMAAINYHFDSRDGLYLAVLKEVHHRFISLDSLRQIAGSALAPSEKLHRFFTTFLAHILESDSWAIRVWAREVISPTSMFEQVVREDTWPKFDALAQIIAEFTGIEAQDPAMPRLVLHTIAPCLVMLITGRDSDTPIRTLFSTQPADLAEDFWRFAVAGLSQVQEPDRR